MRVLFAERAKQDQKLKEKGGSVERFDHFYVEIRVSVLPISEKKQLQRFS